MFFQKQLRQVQVGESRRVKGTVDRTAVHRTKIMLPLGRMQKTPSRPFKAETHLNLDHEKGRSGSYKEPQADPAFSCWVKRLDVETQSWFIYTS